FFPARALPGSAVDAFDWLLAAAPQKDLMSGRAWTTEAIMAQLEKFSALPRLLLGRSLDERIRSFPGDNVGLLDQLRLSQAARGMADLLSERLLKNPARRKPLGSFILAGINPVMAHEFARAYVEHCHGATGTVVRILLSGRSRQETPEIFARIRGELRGKSGGVIVMEEIAAATPHFLETLETILEEGDGPALTRVIFLFPTTVGESLMGNAGFLPSQLHKAVIREVKTQLPPPVWRRTDAIHIADTE
ncbi:hypothetical protein QQ054_11335, partial [Oscillatoria amoena NRMC-F 0135]|nr:hypothetical protein [Oscillatoria amoena NRMC-F 0135]